MNCPRTTWVLSALLSLLVLVGCSGDAPGAGDSHPPGSAPACVAGELTRPDGSCQPAGLPPDMPCPPGERALADGSCQPAGVPPEACAAGLFVPDNRGGCEAILPEQVCPPGQMAVPGERACREVSPCGEGPWGDIPVEATTEHVDQAYAGSDSDGSRERPWKTVQEGVDAAAPSAIVAVAEGRYEEDVFVAGKPVRLWGRCPARTEVVGLGSQDGAIAIARAGASGSEVRGLAVTGPHAGIIVRGARSVVLEGVWVHEAENFGVVVIDRAGATLRGALVEQNYKVGVVVGGAEAVVEATVVRATQPDGAGRLGWGFTVQADEATGEVGKLSLTASLVEQNQAVGVFVSASEATVEATVVRTTQPDDAGRYGEGFEVETDPATGAGGRLWLTASLVEQNHRAGVLVVDSEATIEATVVRATQPSGADNEGPGILVQPHPETGAGGKLWLTASLVEQNHNAGVLVLASEATIEATVVRETQPSGAAERGLGIVVQSHPETGAGGKLRLTAALVEQNQGLGVGVEGSEATISDTVVRATRPDGAGDGGWGIDVQANLYTGERGSLSLTGSLVEDNHEIGVLVTGSEATIKASVVRATKRSPAGLEFGDGIMVMDEQGQSSATIAATASTDNDRAGVMYVGSTGELSGVQSSGNRFGLVLQYGTSGAQPTLGEGNLFEGNTEKDRITGGDLPVPDAALALP